MVRRDRKEGYARNLEKNVGMPCEPLIPSSPSERALLCQCSGPCLLGGDLARKGPGLLMKFSSVKGFHSSVAEGKVIVSIFTSDSLF